MLRRVNVRLELDVAEPAELILSIAVARDGGYESIAEELSVTADGEPVRAQEVIDAHGGVLHVLRPRSAARFVVDYTARVAGKAASPPVDELDLIHYRRPSRYVESDELLATAAAELRGRSGAELLDTVTDWVHRRLAYVSGSSRPTDGAVRTFLSRQGVCRDFAHLTIAMLRACDVPARLASVYAPGLSPMDFHAVTEAYVEDRWHVVDPTMLAPRSSLLRIATGRDAADTAFLTTYEGVVTLRGMQVGAVVDPELPADDRAAPEQLR
ncbi:MAG: transglutaminase-like domain-containing protein [Nocardioidaceae bacterium]